MTDRDLPPEARAALAGRLLLDFLAVMPSTSALLCQSAEEIAAREVRGRAIGEQLRNLVSGRRDEA